MKINNKNIVNKILNLYIKEELTQKQISEKTKISQNTIHKILKINNIQIVYRNRGFTRKYKINETYFEKINTPEKAYWLGWLASDGYVSEKEYQIRLSLIDKEIIENFKKSLKTDYKITTVKFTENSKIQYRITINSKYMIESLKKLGIVNKKSYKTCIPNIPKEFIPYFLRGYFEGDGHISNRNSQTNHCNCQITSCSILMLTQIEEYLKQNKILNKPNSYISKTKNYYRLIIGKTYEAIAFFNLIYKNPFLVLSRKYKKFLEIKNKPAKIKRGKTSKYRGMYYDKINKRFRPRLWHNNKLVEIGYFKTETDAALAYNAKIKELGLPDYMLNKIEENSLDNPIK